MTGGVAQLKRHLSTRLWSSQPPLKVTPIAWTDPCQLAYWGLKGGVRELRSWCMTLAFSSLSSGCWLLAAIEAHAPSLPSENL